MKWMRLKRYQNKSQKREENEHIWKAIHETELNRTETTASERGPTGLDCAKEKYKPIIRFIIQFISLWPFSKLDVSHFMFLFSSSSIHIPPQHRQSHFAGPSFCFYIYWKDFSTQVSFYPDRHCRHACDANLHGSYIGSVYLCMRLTPRNFRFTRFFSRSSRRIHCFIEIWLAMHIRCQYPVKISCCAVIDAWLCVALYSHRLVFVCIWSMCRWTRFPVIHGQDEKQTNELKKKKWDEIKNDEQSGEQEKRKDLYRRSTEWKHVYYTRVTWESIENEIMHEQAFQFVLWY